MNKFYSYFAVRWRPISLGCMIAVLHVSSGILALPPELSKRKLSNPPPRIIRTCCAFGYDLQMSGIPFVRFEDASNYADLGPHAYLGNRAEGNGIIYTKKGGFIDTGHLRDQADWTAYLYLHIIQSRGFGTVDMKLGKEGGKKSLSFDVPVDLSKQDAAIIAGRIAYDIATWHEIGTWYGTSTVPLMRERYSSFSFEDAYSNLLGVRLGMAALEHEYPYEDAMTILLEEAMDELEPVETEQQTLDAMEAVHNKWWTRVVKLPSRHVLLRHEVHLYQDQTPWLIESLHDEALEPKIVELPKTLSDGKRSPTDFYEFKVETSNIIPVQNFFPDRKENMITDDDFPIMLEIIEEELRLQEMMAVATRQRKMQKKKPARVFLSED